MLPHPILGAGGHIRIKADRDGRDHRRPRSSCLAAVADLDIAFQRGTEDGAKGAAARRAAGDPHNARKSAHGGVAIARSESEPLHHCPHQVPIAMVRAQAEELRASVVGHERTALAGIGDERMKQHLTRFRLQDFLVKSANKVAPRACHALDGKHVQRKIEQPVDVQRGRHVGLHLGVMAGHRECHGVAGRLGVQRHRVRVRNKAHMHPRRTDDGAADRRIRVIEPRAKRRADHVDIAETDRHTVGQPCLRRGGSIERMRHGRAVNNLGKQFDQIGNADQSRRFDVKTTFAEVAARKCRL